MQVNQPEIEYSYKSSEPDHSHDYLFDPVVELVKALQPTKIFEVGCGNGSLANRLSEYVAISGIDSSSSAIDVARNAFPHLNLNVGSAYDDLASQYGQFDVVLSLEVIEHLFDPRFFVQRVREMLNPGGTLIISTPYHGYWKNLAIALLGKFDAHYTALWDGGHIKFWSRATLSSLMKEVGFQETSFQRVGRLPIFAKSMIVTFKAPESRS